MKFLKHIRSKSKVKDKDHGHTRGYVQQYSHRTARDATARLPPAILQRIFIELCPLTVDATYDSSEESLVDYGCALCDVKELAQCALVSRRWFNAAQDLLYEILFHPTWVWLTEVCLYRYRNIRIEPVHYCEREYELADKRKRKSFFDRNADPTDAPRERLLLLMRTLRENSTLASRVVSLRLPYMTREGSKAELARTVAVLPNLRYVDVPEGFYTDDASSTALKQELQVSCPEIRRMKYNSGSERSLMHVPQQRIWHNLEILELCGLRLEIEDLLHVLGSFSALQDLKLVDLPWLDDSIFRPTSQTLPLFPPVKCLTLQNTPQIHAGGLATYLSQAQNREALTQLSLSSTGVQPQQLHHVLSRAPYLESLSILEAVERSFPVDPPNRPLASQSLKHLHYEITSALSPRFGGQPPTASYYTYLMSSLLAQPPLLPELTNLYVRDPTFAETLLLAPPSRPFSASKPTFAFTQPLSVFSKGPNELEWNFTSVIPPDAGHGRKSSISATRPISMMGAESLSPAWGGGARRSVVVGNGLGGFLAVPSDDGVRPGSRGSMSSNGNVDRERRDLWR